MSYQREREDFIARMTREGLPIDVIRLLLREATGLNRRAELACSSEAADRDRVKCPASTGYKPTSAKGDVWHTNNPCLCDFYQDAHQTIPRITLQDHHAEERVRKALPAGFTMNTQGDPRGYVLRIMPPSYAERNAGRDQFNLDTIGVPAGPSGLRF